MLLFVVKWSLEGCRTLTSIRMPNATTTIAKNTVSKYTYGQCIKMSAVSFV